MLSEFPWDQSYGVSGIDDVLTPALVIYPDLVAANIERTIELLDGDASRWRVHIKTAKLGYTLRLLVERGVRNFKCATTLELLVACRERSFRCAARLSGDGRECAAGRGKSRISSRRSVISVLAENEGQLQQWRKSGVGLFLDVNPGMNRTGIEQNDGHKVLAMARAIADAGLEFRGLHYYDGQYGAVAEPQRTQAAHRGYDRLLEIVSELDRSGVRVPEVITSGTPTFPCSLSYDGFRRGQFVHRVSPGTVVYCDATSLQELPHGYSYRPAVLVMARVVSRPRAGIVTCDAGHKTVSADAGVPTCVVVGHPELTPLSPSEEHLPMAVAEGAPGPQIGDALFLLPRHICPTVNNFDDALLVRNGKVEGVEKVSARGREAPLLRIAEQGI